MGRRIAAPSSGGGEGEGEDHDGDLETPAVAGARDDPALRSEVAQLLGSLGLPAGAGAGDGFDDRDFRPKAAAPPPKAARRGSEREAAAAPPAREAKRERAGGKAAAATSAADADDAAPRAPQPRKGRRDWAFGAGPAPAPPALDAPASGGARDRTGVWFVDAASLPPLPPAPRGGPPLDVSALRAEGAAALAAEEAGGGRGNRTTAEAAWLRVVRTAGTGADRVAAATVQAQRDPIAHGRALDSLLEMCAGARAAGGKRAAGQALDALRELFALHLLPDRKLRRFEEQPLAAVAALRPGDSRRAQHLLYWHYEAALKAKFGRFVEALLELSRDPLEWLKERAVAAAAALLRAKPEGEAPLLRLLVNKLGDPGRKAASAAAYQLAQLLAAHPAMKGVVVREVGHFAFRPRIGLRAQYTAVVFVSQLALSHRGADPAVAEQMITLYFDLFQSLLAAPIEAGAAADGAFRGKGSPAAGVAAKAKAGGKKGGKGSGKPKKKGTEGPAGPDAVADASVGVDSRLLRALLTGINRALPYVPAEAADALVERVSPAVYRIAHGSSLGAACQALALLYQMMASKAAASDRFYRALYDALLAPALPRSASAAMFLALLFRAARADVNPKRVAAIIKRLLQVACTAPAPFACGALLLTSEVLREQPALWAAALQAEEGDGEERFADAPLPSDDEGEGGADPDAVRRRERAERDTLSARFELSDSEDGDGRRRAAPAPLVDEAAPLATQQPARPGGGLGRALPGGYDMAKRDPQHSGADRAGLWELAALAAHMHPSVAAMARSLLAGAHVSYDGDPLRDMALAAFLDRWLQKKPKAAKVAADAAARMGRRNAAGEGDKAAPGSAEFAAMMEEDVDPSDVFFHRYFAAVAAKAKAEARARRRHRGGGGSDDDEDGDGDGSDDDDAPDAAYAARRAAAAARRGEGGGDDDDDEFGGDSDSELEAALEAAERDEVGGAADDGHDYADLAAAMQGGSSKDGDPSESDFDDDDEDDEQPASRKRKAGAGGGMSVFADAEDFEEALAAGGVERPEGGSDASSEGDDVAEYDEESDSDGGRFLAPGSDDEMEEEAGAGAGKKGDKKRERPARVAVAGAGKARRGKRSTGARAVRNHGAEQRKFSMPKPAAEAKAPAKKAARKY